MSDLQKRLAGLSPEQRRLLLEKLKKAKSTAPKIKEIPKRKDTRHYPLSFGQKGFWFLEQIDRQSSVNNIPSALELSGNLNIKAMQETLNAIIRRQDTLRSYFKTENGQPVVHLQDNVHLKLPLVDLTSLAPDEKETRARQLIEEEAQLHFELDKAPLMRAKVLRLEERRHIMLLTLHHIIADAWSVGVLVQEIITLYSAALNKGSVNLPDLEIDYFDYAAWQENFLKSEQVNKQLSYWREALKDMPSALQLHGDRPRPAVQTYAGHHLRFDLAQDLSEKLIRLSRENNVTLFMTLLAAYQVLLYRYTNQDDFGVGAPLANRDYRGSEGLIGLFINTMVMRAQLQDNPSFEQLLQQVKEDTLQAFSNNDIPFEMVVNELNPEREISHNPLFQVLFDFRNTPSPKLQLPDLSIRLLEQESGTVKFDLVLSMEQTENGLNGIFGFNTDLFGRQSIERMISHFQTLLKGICENPQQPVSSLPLLSKQEERRILYEWNDTEKSLNGYESLCVHNLFEQQAEQNPGQPALIIKTELQSDTEAEVISLAELNGRANRLARYLLEKGVVSETLIALSMERSVEMFVALLAILKAGGAYIPIDPDYPPERVNLILQDSQAGYLLTQEKYRSRFDNSRAKIIAVDTDWPEIAKQPEANPGLKIKHNALVYLIYTSGSTGTPKAVLVKHGSLLNHALATAQIYKLSATERILQFISLSFDAAGEEIYPALISGTPLVLPPKAASMTPYDVARIVEQTDVSVLHLPALFWPTFIDYLADHSLMIPETLKLVVVGGEAPSPQDLVKARQLTKNHLLFINAYGPTETTITSCYYEAKPQDEIDFPWGQFPIGKPLPNMRMYILDGNLKPLPPGVPGEIYIGGMGVARGYLHRPELTAEKFIPDPFSDSPEARLYRTGDLGRYTEDGNIMFSGRVDFQLKLRGFRIELGEIEAVLKKHEAVTQAVVIAREHENLKYLAAYLVQTEQEKISDDDLRSYLARHLPDYMIPAAFFFLDEIPKTTTGKVDRKALEALDSGVHGPQTEYVPAQSKLEKFIHDMWKDILGLERISIHDNFFTLGGSSIQGATYVNRLQDVLGEYVYIVAIYDAPTIAGQRDLLIKDYPKAVFKITGEKVASEDEIKRIDEKDIAHFRKIIWTPGPPKAVNKTPKNPPAVFVISSPRSGSTLTRAILGGSPKLFSPPELQLLNYDTLQDRKKHLTGRDDFWLDGTIRAIMEVKHCSSDEAWAIMEEFENNNTSTKDFYRRMQEWIGDQIFVDKTPNYALHTDILQRAEEYFENTLYIHLIRHPYGVIPSFEKARLHVFYPPFFNGEQDFTSREMAELVWLISHQNILHFLKHIPQERQYRLFYEDLVIKPEETVRSMCEFLNIEMHPDMLEPQKNKEQRMTTGLNDLSKMLGDVRFHEHKGITAERAYSWKKKLKEDYLGEATWQLIEDFGYESRTELEYALGKVIRPIGPLAKGEKQPLSFSQQRLWFLDQLEPDSPFYNMPLTVRLRGWLDFGLLEKTLNTIVARHDNLRTAFITVDGQPQVDIAASLSLKMNLTDLSKLNRDKKEAQTEKIIRQEAARPFNLAKAPLVRATLIRLAEDDFIFLLNMHHIISDGMSLEIFVKEVSAIYLALRQGKESPLPELPLQYGAYAKWQRQWLESPVLQKQLLFWREQMSGAPALLQLPTDRPRPKMQSYKGGKAFFELPDDINLGINKLAAQHQVTPYVILLAAFSVLLHRYAGQDDICIGTPVSGRTRREVENLIGFFVNSLPLRFDLFANPAFDEFIEETQLVVQDTLSHQDVPFEKIVDTLNLERDTSYTPLFQVMFIYQQSPLPNIDLGRLTIEPLQVDSGTSKFDLSLAMVEDEGRFRGMFEYNSDLFNKETVSRFTGHFINLLQDGSLHPQKKVQSLNLLNEKDIKEILQRFEHLAPEDGQRDINVVRLFEEQAAKAAHNTALIYKDKSVTYGELNEQANRLARYLIDRGAGPEQVVGLSVRRSVEMMTGLLAILKTGAAYVPIDPSYPDERIAYIIQDSDISLVLTQQELEGQFSGNIQTICLDTLNPPFAGYPADNPGVTLHPENLAYLIYTSGSTGQPKAVMVAHSGLVNHALVTKDELGLCASDRVLQYISISFDASAEEIYPSLLSGAALVLPDSAAELGGAELLEITQNKKISVLHLPVPVWHYFIDYISGQNTKIPSSVRLMLAGGETPSIAKFHLASDLAKQKITFLNLYGPTEATITSTFYKAEISKMHAFEQMTVPIGRPIPNTAVYILDGQMQPVPSGVVGEIYIGGAGVTRGYRNRPDLTADKFLPDPFSGKPGARLYRTGDLGRFSSGGDIIFSGRSDFQVKVRGFRIELGEVESALAAHDDVNEVIVMARGTERTAQLIAYVVPRKDAEIRNADLRAFLSETLPDYMVPSYFVFLDEVPKTQTGKIDRRKLPEPIISREDLQDEFIAPRNDKEERLAAIWRELLKMEQVGMRDNFFELGGDSILSIQVIARANQAGLKLTPKQLFEYPTIEGLAAVAEEGVAIQAEQGPVSGTFALTPIQHWFFDLQFDNPNHWNQSLAVELNEALDTEALRKTVQVILQQHDMLRGRFISNGERILAEIPESVSEIPFSLFDLSASPPDELAQRMEEAGRQTQVNFDISSGPLFNTAYIKTPQGEKDILQIVVHHLAVDGISWRVLTEDILNAYQQAAQGKEIQLPPKTTSFKYWAEKLNEYAHSETIKEELDYWQSQLQNADSGLPVDNPQGANTETEAQAVSVSLSEEETQQLLSEAPAAYQTQINELLLSALLKAYFRWTGANNLLLDLEGHGREDIFEDVNISRTVGWFTVSYPFALQYQSAWSPADLIRNVKETYRRIPGHGIGFGLLRYLNNSTETDFLTGMPGAAIGFNYLGQFDGQDSEDNALGRARAPLGKERGERNGRIHSLEIGGSVTGNRLNMNFSFSTAQLDEAKVQGWAEIFMEELRSIIEHCLSPDAGGYTASDFQDVELEDSDLDDILDELE